MIRFHLARLMADKGFKERRRLELGDVSEATGIHRSTLSRVLNRPGANLTADNMSRLCAYFACGLGELAEYVPDDPAPPSAPDSPRKPASKTTVGKAASRTAASKAASRKTSRRAAAQ